MGVKAPIFIFLIALLVISYNFVSDNGFNKLNSLKTELGVKKEKSCELRKTVTGKKSQVIKFKRDSDFLEGYLRENLGYGREGEVVYVFNN